MKSIRNIALSNSTFNALGFILSTVFVLAGCSSSSTTPAQTTVSVKPVELNLVAKATLVAPGQIMVDITDTSGAASSVMSVSNVVLDELEDAQGEPVQVKLRDHAWRLIEEDTSTPELPPGSLQLGLAIQGRVQETIGHLEGTFEIHAGSHTDLSLPLSELTDATQSNATQSNATKLKELGIKVTAQFVQQLRLSLSGPDVDQLATLTLVNSANEELKPESSSISSGSTPAESQGSWGWKAKGQLGRGGSLKIWLKSDDPSGPPSWVVELSNEPVQPIRHDSLGIAGELAVRQMAQGKVSGPKTALLAARFVDVQETLQQDVPRFTAAGLNHEIAVSASVVPDSAALQLRISEDAKRSTILYSFDNLPIESPR